MIDNDNKVRIMLRFTVAGDRDFIVQTEEQMELVVARPAITDREAFQTLVDIMRGRLLHGDTAKERAAIVDQCPTPVYVDNMKTEDIPYGDGYGGNSD